MKKQFWIPTVRFRGISSSFMHNEGESRLYRHVLLPHPLILQYHFSNYQKQIWDQTRSLVQS